MDPNLIKEALLRQRKFVGKNLIDRDKYAELKTNLNNPFIILISGVRRCGKSTLLKKELFEESYYVNFDDERFIDFSVNDFSKMYELLKELFNEKKYFIFDEIQNIVGWERFVRRLHNEGNKVLITGSNATLLSKELGTHLTGRNIMLSLYPFSFNEFLRFNNNEFDFNRLISDDKAKIKRLFNEYMKMGGFPEFLKTKNEDYLKSLYDNILYKDIIARYNIQTEIQLREVIYHTISNLGKELSFNSLKNLVGLSNSTTVKDYFYYLENTFLIFLVNRYNKSIKKQIQVPKKAYCIDTALALNLGFRFSEDSGRLLENIVFLQLKRQNKEIYYHKEKQECDFLIKESTNITQAIQVCYTLDEENKKREIKGLVEACKTHKLRQGLLLTYDQEDEFQKDNVKIKIMPVWRWLLG